MQRSPENSSVALARRERFRRTEGRAARDADTIYVHAPGRSMTRLSKRRVLLVLAAVVSAVVTTGFSLGFLLHAAGHG